MIHRLTIFILSIVVLLLITERKSVTHVTPVTPPKRKDAHVIKSDDDEESRWAKRTQDLGDAIRSSKLAMSWSDENE